MLEFIDDGDGGYDCWIKNRYLGALENHDGAFLPDERLWETLAIIDIRQQWPTIDAARIDIGLALACLALRRETEAATIAA